MVIWSLFDGSGYQVINYAEAGHTVFLFNADDADHGEYSCKLQHPNMYYVNTWIEPGFDPTGCVWYGEGNQQRIIPKPDIIFSFPPCTDMAVSGARHFKKKLEKDPLCQDLAVVTAKIASFLALKYDAEYMIENPVSILSSRWRKCDYIFHPYQYGGYLPEDDIHPMYPDYIKPRDAYPKKTCLWTSKGFIMPPPLPVKVDVGSSVQYKQLGGKSAKTKMIRSLTPRGFAKAVFLYNS